MEQRKTQSKEQRKIHTLEQRRTESKEQTVFLHMYGGN